MAPSGAIGRGDGNVTPLGQIMPCADLGTPHGLWPRKGARRRSAGRAVRPSVSRKPPRRRKKRLVASGFWVELPIGIEPMTYALRGGLEPSSPVHRSIPSEVAGLVRSTRVPNHPRLLLADSLAQSAALTGPSACKKHAGCRTLPFTWIEAFASSVWIVKAQLTADQQLEVRSAVSCRLPLSW
jgi:hypothetical protein